MHQKQNAYMPRLESVLSSDNYNSLLDLDKHEYLLCIVIVAKNEQRFIEKCIRSCLESVKDIENCRIILVDSISSDETITLAKNFNIAIYQLTNQKLLSPAAGKYMGYFYSNSKYLCFIDGDMVVDKNWFKFALPFMQKNPEIAGMGGLRPDISEEKLNEFIKSNAIATKNVFDYIKVLDGASLFNREYLDIAGCYNPFLRGEEEAELSFRLINKKFKLVRVNVPMIYHLGIVKHQGVAINRIKYYQGIGYILRLYIGTKFQWYIYKYYLESIFNVTSILLSIALLILGIISYYFIILSVLLNLILLTAAFCYQKKISLSIYALIKYYLKAFYIIYGFSKECRMSEDYPKEILVIKK